VQSTRRTRQAVPKHARASASQDEPSQKKARKGFEAAVSTQMPKVIPSDTEEQEEEEEEDAASSLCPRVCAAEAHSFAGSRACRPVHCGRRAVVAE